MKRFLVVGALSSILAGTLILSAVSVLAQGAPPGLPSTFYGSVSGGPQPGDPIVAFITVGGQSATCGIGAVINDNGPKYVIDVFADDNGTYDNCGASGRTVRFYFPKTKQFANQSGTWQVGLAPETQINPATGFALTAGAAMTNRAVVPGSAKFP